MHEETLYICHLVQMDMGLVPLCLLNLVRKMTMGMYT